MWLWLYGVDCPDGFKRASQSDLHQWTAFTRDDLKAVLAALPFTVHSARLDW